MTQQELVDQEQTAELRERLAHPDPDPADLPAVSPPELVQQEAVAARILRSSLTLDTWIEQQKARMQSDIEAWQHSIATLEAKRQAWRAMIRDWMLRTGVQQIRCPWFTASITKGKTKIVVDDEAGAIAAVKAAGGQRAVKVVEKLIKAEFDAIFNAIPKTFEGVAHEETGEPSLMVRKAKEGV